MPSMPMICTTATFMFDRKRFIMSGQVLMDVWNCTFLSIGNWPQACPTCWIVTCRGVKRGCGAGAGVGVLSSPARPPSRSGAPEAAGAGEEAGAGGAPPPPMSSKSKGSAGPLVGGGGGGALALAAGGPKSSKSNKSPMPPPVAPLLAGGFGGGGGSAAFFATGAGGGGGCVVPTVMPPAGLEGPLFALLAGAAPPTPEKRRAAIFCFSVSSGGSCLAAVLDDFIEVEKGEGESTDAGGFSAAGSGSFGLLSEPPPGLLKPLGPHFLGPETLSPVGAASFLSLVESSPNMSDPPGGGGGFVWYDPGLGGSS
mmetsp:Transcript_74687/g.140836  ORF Transcript_74687/g.140836 Transcript_74687/m.140836 type:complete len:311 (+) Transcript_74687:246-1178(+)